MSDNNELEQIAFKVGTDKSRIKHLYTKWYYSHFKDIKDNNLNILEIGVNKGKSINLWKKYFKKANVYGIEINENVIEKSLTKGCKIFIGSQTDRSFLNKVIMKTKGGMDIIIDDGSHVTSDQINTFLYLFDKLNSGGVYVVEDLQTSYRKKYKKGECKNFVNFLKNKIDDVNYHGKSSCNNFNIVNKKELNKFTKYEKIIESMHFYAGICFVIKRSCA